MEKSRRREISTDKRAGIKKRPVAVLLFVLAAALAVSIVSVGNPTGEKAAMNEYSTNGERMEGRYPSGGTARMGLNRLAYEKSPYLLQHASNPVDWYPWGEEAFHQARTENKPIFLSIGYSTCHWCHVMEHESFEDPGVARLMNEHFICIKVDREERPDIDHLYMTVCQLMTGSGGWPLTIIMTPEQKPFFAATYIPKEDRFGRVGMLNLIPQVSEVWKNRRSEVEHSADKIVESLSAGAGMRPGERLEEGLLGETAALLRREFDAINGGFGSAPKFPTPHNLLFLLRHWKRNGDDAILSIVETTLLKMRLGGIYDHIGFGFHRYSTDASWHLPHFEKMLYDQALLLLLYTEAYQATGRREYRQTAEEIITYISRDMTDPAGGFYSAEDADSEGEEGKYYVWDMEELNEILDPDEFALVAEMFGISKNGNFIDEAEGDRSGSNILHQELPMREFADKKGIARDELQNRWEEIRQILFSVRENRSRPQRDDKILTDWNGLMIAALSRAARAFDEPRYRQQAERSAEFVLRTLRTDNGRLLHRFRDGEAAIKAHVDDYAFFIWGLIELYEATFEVDHLENALRLNSIFMEHFWDDERGGFYFTADDGEQLLVRDKELYDGALPSGNSVAMFNLVRLARMTADSELEQRAARIGRAFSDVVRRNPRAHTFLISALDFMIGPTWEVVVVAGDDPEETQRMLEGLHRAYLPHVVVLHKGTNGPDRMSDLAPFTESLSSLDGNATAYVCHNFSCDLPTADPHEMMRKLR